MANLKASKRYAKGLLDYAIQSKQDVLLYEEMQEVAQIVKESRELQNFLRTPIVDNKKKKQVLREILSSKSELAKKFAELLVSHQRADLLGGAAYEYVKLYDERNGIVEVTITTAEEIGDATRFKLLSKVQTLAPNKKLKVKSIINPEIIGGFIVKVGDQQIDNSLKSKLHYLKQEFSENYYKPKF